MVRGITDETADDLFPFLLLDLLEVADVSSVLFLSFPVDGN